MSRKWEKRLFWRTDNDGTDTGMVEHPARRNICNACTGVAVADCTQHGEQLLEERPVAPGLDDHVEVLHNL